MSYRAFVGVPVPGEPPLLALLEDLAGTGADLKVVDPAQIHLTLSFLGEVPDDATPRLGAALDEATRGVVSFRLRLHGVGAFPDPRRPRVIWAGARPSEALDRLAARVRDALARAGCRDDGKPFHAHVTLARIRSNRGIDRVAGFLGRHAHAELPEAPVDHVRLYRSTLGPRGPTYETLHRAGLEA